MEKNRSHPDCLNVKSHIQDRQKASGNEDGGRYETELNRFSDGSIEPLQNTKFFSPYSKVYIPFPDLLCSSIPDLFYPHGCKDEKKRTNQGEGTNRDL